MKLKSWERSLSACLCCYCICPENSVSAFGQPVKCLYMHRKWMFEL
uniref:Uncharacterized protein n=1 Tax=Anguilla anguilla TaxID=7936 RepID=A0A0E9S9N4_ANGAN